jgi:hypothetical protein
LGKGQRRERGPTVTILFISLSAAQYNLETDWAEAGAELIPRRCPICVQDSIVGHGRRRPARRATFETEQTGRLRAAAGILQTPPEHRGGQKMRKDWPVNRQACA